MIKKSLKRMQDTVYTYLDQSNFEMMERFLGWFHDLLNLQFALDTRRKLVPNIGDIYFVKLGWNIGSEIAKMRPCIVISKRFLNAGDCVLVAPLKTFRGKIYQKHQVLISIDSENQLNQDSVCDLMQMRSVSKRRFGLKRIGYVGTETMYALKQKISFVTKQKDTG